MKTTKRLLKTQWQSANKQANLIIDQWLPQLDRRKSSFKDEATNRRVLASFLAYREGDFEVVLGNSREEDRDCLRDATEALVGNVLQRTKGRNGYKFNPSLILPVTKVMTTNVTLKNTITTKLGAIYRDETYSQRVVKDFCAIGQARVVQVKITDPFANMMMLSGQIPDGHRNWHNLPDIEPTEEAEKIWSDFVERLEEAAFRQAIACYPVAEVGVFLTTQLDRLVRLIQQTAIKHFGTARISPSLICTDKFGKRHKVWGTFPVKNKSNNKVNT